MPKSIENGIEKCLSINNTKLAGQYIELKNRYRKINYQLLLKTWILGQMIGYSFENHVIVSALNHTDRTLGVIKISIDQDFIKEPQHVIYWKKGSIKDLVLLLYI